MKKHHILVGKNQSSSVFCVASNKCIAQESEKTNIIAGKADGQMLLTKPRLLSLLRLRKSSRSTVKLDEKLLSKGP